MQLPARAGVELLREFGLAGKLLARLEALHFFPFPMAVGLEFL